MMNNIIKSKHTAILLAWSLTLCITSFVVFKFLKYTPTGNSTARFSKGTGKNVNFTSEELKNSSNVQKENQNVRTLPNEYANNIAGKTEKKTELELKNQLRQFEHMYKVIRKQSTSILQQVRRRKLSPGVSQEANNTSIVKLANNLNSSSLDPELNSAAIYELLRKYESEIQSQHLAVSAAKRALGMGLSFLEVYKDIPKIKSQMPSFEHLVDNELSGTNGHFGNGRSGINIKTTEGLRHHREVLGQAARQASLARTRLESFFGGGRNVMDVSSSGERTSFGSASGSSNGNINGSPGNGQEGGTGNGQEGGTGNGQGGGGGNGYGSGGLGYAGQGSGDGGFGKNPIAAYQGPRLDAEQVKAQALPGRRFSKSAKRKGWLYVNTWYMIGPWENYGRDDFAISHPPEIAVDFDALYDDGQKGIGVIETDSHPLEVKGKKVRLDGRLKWKFMQSESMHNTVPVTTNHSTYYAFTELYFEEAANMLVAMGTDDSGRIWINGKEVWQDRGTSWYNIDEHITSFQFKKGWNRVLVRLENGGGGPTGFSFLICPKNAVQ